jgi:hypothetical protein
MGYEIDEAEVAYWGRCPICLAQARAPSGSEPPAPHAEIRGGSHVERARRSRHRT